MNRMKELTLKYGCNPNQTPSRIFMENGGPLPVEILNGNPGYINFLDALNGWQLVQELKLATGLPSAASFKHVSPAGAACGRPLTPVLRQSYRVEEGDVLSPLAAAYARARGADRMSSFGDFVALSDRCDLSTATLIRREVSDGVIAPDFDAEALALLKEKKKGAYNIIRMDAEYRPSPTEKKQVFGVTFEQGRNHLSLDETLFRRIVTENKLLPKQAKTDLLVALITLKYTQSNSVCYAFDGQAIGIGAGQQSRIHCTRLAGDKADRWFLRQSPEVLSLPFRKEVGRADRDNAIDVYLGRDAAQLLSDGNWERLFTRRPAAFTEQAQRERRKEMHGISLGSDAFFPFGDNIEWAHQSGVLYVAQPGGSIRDDQVIETCNKYNMVMTFTGVRLFHH